MTKIAQNSSIDRLVRPHLLDIETYDPVDPPELLAKRAGIPEDQIIKLNGNENPFGSSPSAVDAVANAPLHVYPDPLQRSIREALSIYTGLDERHIIAGAGSDELIDLLFRLFISPGDSIIDSDPTFGMYGFGARIAGAKTVKVPRDDGFNIDIDRVIDEAGNPGAKIIFVSSPNNPTGNIVSEYEVRKLLDTGLLIVVDEAYFEFANEIQDYPVSMAYRYDNVITLRSFSKAYGLGGIRIGYGLAHDELISNLLKVKVPFEPSLPAQIAGLAALDDSEFLLETIKTNKKGMRFFKEELDILGIEHIPSATNFITTVWESENQAIKLSKSLLAKGIIVRHLSSFGWPNCIRISIGIEKENNRFIPLNQL